MSTERRVIIAHAPGEEEYAERLEAALEKNGIGVIHRGTLDVGDSFFVQFNAALYQGLPVLFCGTPGAIGSKWATEILSSASGRQLEVYPVRMDDDANLEMLFANKKIAECAGAKFEVGIAGLVGVLDRVFAESGLGGSTEGEETVGAPSFLDGLTSEWDFDETAVSSYRKSLRSEVLQKYPEFLTNKVFLERMQLIRKGKLTVAGTLLFGPFDDNMYCPMAITKCSVCRGETATRKYYVRGEDFSGRVHEQIQKAYHFVIASIERRERRETGQPELAMVYQYPEDCLREIVANALCHRDYEDKNRPVLIQVFSNRIEITSPGDWASRRLEDKRPYLLDELISKPVQRNPSLARAIRNIKLFEGNGLGIPTSVDDCKKSNAEMARVTQSEGNVTVTIYPVRDWDLKEVRREVESVKGKAESQWPGVSVPLDGPKVSEPFAGREEELGELGKAMGGDENIVAVVGMAGQGKSCLVGEWYKRGAQPREGVGLFWRKVYEAGYSFDRFLDDLHVYLTGEKIDRRKIRTVEERAAAVEAVLREKPCWIVLDGAERWLKRWAAEPDAGAENLTADERAGQDEVFDKFLKGAWLWENGSRLVLTTRAVPSALDENPPVRVGRTREPEAKLEDLKAEEAVELLEKLGVKGEKAAKLEAVRAYGCHAYAVHVLGVLITDLYGGEVSRWREVNPLGGTKLAGLFERIIENRGEDLGLLEYVASSVGPARVEMLPELCGLGEAEVRRRLAALARWQMAEFAGGSEAEQHTVVRQVLAQRMGQDRVRELRRQIAAWWAKREVPARPLDIEEVRPLLKGAEHLVGAGDPDVAANILHTKWSAESYYNLNEWLLRFGYLDESIRINGAVIGEYVRLVEKEGRRELRNDLARCYNNRGNALADQGKLAEAICDYGRANEIYKDLVEKEGRRELRNDLAMCYNNRGGALADQGKLDEAIGDYARAIEIYEGLVEKEGRRELRNDLASSYNNRGLALAHQGKLDEAIADYGRAIEIREELVEKEGRRELINDLVMSYNNRGGALADQGKLAEAIGDYGRAIEIREELVEKEGRRELRRDLAGSVLNRALARGQMGEWKEARADVDRGGALLIGLIEEGQSQVLGSFFKTAGFRCRWAGQLGDIGKAGEWANAAMGWFIEEVEAGRENEMLLRAGAEFADDVRGNPELLLKAGLDENLLERFLRTLKSRS